MSILEQILARPDKNPVPVATPEWPELDGKLAVRRLSPTDRVAFDQACADQQIASGAAFITFVAVYCTVIDQPTAWGAEFQRAFADDDWHALAEDAGSGSAIDRLFEASDELNLLSVAARARLKKNSERAGDSAPTSGSPGTPASP